MAWIKTYLLSLLDPPPQHPASGPGPSAGAGKKAQKAKRKRVLDSNENVYLVQLAWKGSGRLILEEREKLLRQGQIQLSADPSHSHLNVCETQSDPLGGLAIAGKMSPRIRRSSKIIASGVRRLSRSFYGADSNLSVASPSLGGSSQQLSPPGLYQQRQSRQRRVTTAAGGMTQSTSQNVFPTTEAPSNGAMSRLSLRGPRQRRSESANVAKRDFEVSRSPAGRAGSPECRAGSLERRVSSDDYFRSDSGNGTGSLHPNGKSAMDLNNGRKVSKSGFKNRFKIW